MKILYFTATWCGPCKTFKPIVQQAMVETGANVQFIDVDQNKEAIAKYLITSVPTILVVNDNDIEVNRQPGIMSKPHLISLLNQYK